MMKNYQKYLLPLGLILGLGLSWELSAAVSNKTRLLFSSPILISEYFFENWLTLLKATAITSLEAFLGLIVAGIFSIGTMVLCLFNQKLLRFVLPVMIVSQVIPLITLAPLFIMVFGIGLTSKIMMAALISFFPIFINFNSGVKLISTNINELMKVHNASKWQKIRWVYFPLSLPNIISGFKVAATLSVIGAIIAEFSGAQVGLGKNLYLAAVNIEPELMMNSLALSSLLGGTIYGLIFIFEFFFGKWYLTKSKLS